MNDLEKLSAYCEKFTSLPVPILDELERETYLKTMSPQMISGKLQGQFLSLLSALVRPAAALEIGTFTGYSSICIASRLPENGILHTIDVNPELRHINQKYFEKAGLQHKIQAYLGDAREIIPTLKMNFDFVFIDAAKTEYPAYYDLVFDKVNPGGLILADNVLWSGKVLSKAGDADTLAIQAFNQKVHADKRVETLMLPHRDGILIARKL